LQWFLLCILYVQQVHIHYLPIVNGQVVVVFACRLWGLNPEPFGWEWNTVYCFH
jgi:hypothetical protein